MLRNHTKKKLNFLTNRPFIFKNVTLLRSLIEALQHGIDGVEQIKEGSFVSCRCVRFEFELARDAWENVFLPRFQHREPGGGILEFLVLNELSNQFPTRILTVVVAFRLHLLVNG